MANPAEKRVAEEDEEKVKKAKVADDKPAASKETGVGDQEEDIEEEEDVEYEGEEGEEDEEDLDEVRRS